MSSREASGVNAFGNISMQKGITLIELLIVIAIVALLGASASSFYSNFVLRNNFDITLDKLISTIRKAQNYSLDGKDDAPWGVCLAGNKIRLFRGDSCSVNAFHEDFDYPSSITIGGLSETSFSHLKGEPSSPLTVTVTSSLQTTSFNLNHAGGIEYQFAPSPTPGPTATPSPTATPTPTPTSPPASCNDYCLSIGYSSGICLNNTNQCLSAGGFYAPGGDQFCTKICCCLP